MNFRPIILFLSLFLFLHNLTAGGCPGPKCSALPGYRERIEEYIDSLEVFDTHEHLFNPEALRETYFLDFTLLLHQNMYDDLVSSGMPATAYNQLFNQPLTPTEKWKIIEPYWNKSFNTASNRIILLSIKDLYGIDSLNASTVDSLSIRIKQAYAGDWFNHVIKDLCKIDNVIQEADFIGVDRPYVNYTDQFSDWIMPTGKFQIDSLAVAQLEPIITLEDYVKSMSIAFEQCIKMGMVAVKVNLAYVRSLSFDKVTPEAAAKVFNQIRNGNESHKVSLKDAKPLQDFMLRKLVDMAGRYKLPVTFHTGLQAGRGNVIENSNPALLTNLIMDYPNIKFVIYHGSYPYGGLISTMAKTFPNVYFDMNWVYAISPSYAKRYLNEWIETVPVSKIIGFGGDQRCVENTYGQLIIAKKIISEVLSDKVNEGYLTEYEAKTIARMILHDNGIQIYNIRTKPAVTPQKTS